MKNTKMLTQNLIGFMICLLLTTGLLSAASIGDSEQTPEETVETGLDAVAEIEAIVEEIPTFAASVTISDSDSSGVHFFNSDSVGPDEIRNGDMVVFGGTGAVEGRVKGSLVVFGGSAHVSGYVEGDLVVFGGSANLESTAHIDGDTVVIGGMINRDEGSYVQGDVVVLGGAGTGLTDQIVRPDFGIFKSGFRLTILLTWLVISFVITLLFTRSVENTVEIAMNRPVQALLTGFIFHVAALMTCIVLFVIIVGIPLAFLGSLLWFMISIFGTAVGFVLMGRLVWEKIRKGYANTLMILITGFLILAAIRFVPFFIGWTIWQLWGMAGIGATVLSRFGSNKPWFGSRQTAPQYPAEPPVTPSESLT